MTSTEENGNLAHVFAIIIKIRIIYLRKNAVKLANFIEKIEIIYVIKPRMIIIPKNGPANIFEIQKVKDIVLKLRQEIIQNIL